MTQPARPLNPQRQAALERRLARDARRRSELEDVHARLAEAWPAQRRVTLTEDGLDASLWMGETSGNLSLTPTDLGTWRLEFSLTHHPHLLVNLELRSADMADVHELLGALKTYVFGLGEGVGEVPRGWRGNGWGSFMSLGAELPSWRQYAGFAALHARLTARWPA